LLLCVCVCVCVCDIATCLPTDGRILCRQWADMSALAYFLILLPAGRRHQADIT